MSCIFMCVTVGGEADNVRTYVQDAAFTVSRLFLQFLDLILFCKLIIYFLYTSPVIVIRIT